jgi:hypothetical protein
VDDALFVRRFDGFRDLPCDRQRLSDSDRSLRNAIRQRRPLDLFNDECERTPSAFSRPWMIAMLG